MAGGDRHALGELYVLHGAVLQGVARRLMGSREAAADLVQDVLLQAWQRAATYDPERSSVRTWLLLRLRSRGLDRLRAQGRRAEVLADGSLELGHTQDNGSAVDAGRVQGVLAALPEDQREVLTLTYFHGWSASEIAGHLGVPQGTVKSRRRLALLRLRSALDAARDPS